VIDDFFTTDFCQSLLDQFPDFKNKDAIDENQTLGKKAVVQTMAAPIRKLKRWLSGSN
jgi:hypothetical protein